MDSTAPHLCLRPDLFCSASVSGEHSDPEDTELWSRSCSDAGRGFAEQRQSCSEPELLAAGQLAAAAPTERPLLAGDAVLLVSPCDQSCHSLFWTDDPG